MLFTREPLLDASAQWVTVLAALLLLPLCGPVASGTRDEHVEKADDLQAQGDFEGARAEYQAALAMAPDDPHAVERLGFIHFLKGEYPQAIERFRQVIALRPARRRLMLAYTAFAHYHLRHYAEAADLLDELGGANLLSAEQLRLLARWTPYRIQGSAGTAILPFLQVDPLPVVEIGVNSRTISVLIDTGAGQLVLDSELAREMGVRPVSSQGVKGAAGGKTAGVSFGMVDSVSLGGTTLGKVPVWVLPTRMFSSDFGRTIDGILGTEVLMQFLPTLDYPGKRLILRPRNGTGAAEAEARRAKAGITFVIEGIHYLYAPCVINGGKPVLMYFDSGLADDHGAAMALNGSALADLGIQKPSLDQEGVGIGGAFKHGYVETDSVRVGSLEQRNLKATCRDGEGQLLKPAGYRSYGLISHHFLKRYRWTIDFDRRAFLFEE
jgi:tetratricopeptide (TPR) repeat protein